MPESEQHAVTRQEFQLLASKWRRETKHHSNLNIVFKHPIAVRLVAAGQQIVPWCLEALQNDRCLSFCVLLSRITGANPAPKPDPVAPGFYGIDVEECVQAWLAWGTDQGHLP